MEFKDGYTFMLSLDIKCIENLHVIQWGYS